MEVKGLKWWVSVQFSVAGTILFLLFMVSYLFSSITFFFKDFEQNLRWGEKISQSRVKKKKERERERKRKNNIYSVKWSEVAQSCLTLCNPMNYSLPGSSIRGIFQARILEWAAISFSRGSSWPRDRTPSLPHCRLTLYCLFIEY